MQEFLEKIKDIRFTSVEDMFEKRDFIQERYLSLPKEAKEIYKWYFFYELCLLEYNLKSTMWDYITGVGEEIHLRLAYMDFKRKKEKYHQKYLLEEQRRKESIEKKEQS